MSMKWHYLKVKERRNKYLWTLWKISSYPPELLNNNITTRNPLALKILGLHLSKYFLKTTNPARISLIKRLDVKSVLKMLQWGSSMSTHSTPSPPHGNLQNTITYSSMWETLQLINICGHKSLSSPIFFICSYLFQLDHKPHESTDVG